MRAIHTQDDYAEAKRQLALLWRRPDVAEEMEVWGILIEDYESRTVVYPDLDPIEVIKADMEMTGHTKGDLGAIIGPTRVSDILEKRRHLTVKMIRDISETWRIPAKLLLGEYRLTPLRGAHTRKPATDAPGKAAA